MVAAAPFPARLDVLPFGDVFSLKPKPELSVVHVTSQTSFPDKPVGLVLGPPKHGLMGLQAVS